VKNAIKRVFLGVCTVGFCLLEIIATYGVIIAYSESFKAVGIIAILMFIYATICLAMLLYSYWVIGDSIMYIREKNKKKKED
jgi:hypothetical protein